MARMCNLHGRVQKRELAGSISVPQEPCDAQSLLFNLRGAEESNKGCPKLSILSVKDKDFELKVIEKYF